MGALSTLFSQAVYAGPPDHDDYWYSPRSQMSQAGEPVSVETALGLSAVFGCVRVLAETVGMLPLITYRRTGDYTKERATDLGIYEVLHDQPNSWQTSIEWREQSMGHCALRGNAYNIIESSPRSGAVAALIPLDPDRMIVEQVASRRLLYKYTWQDGARQTFNQDQIFHLRGLSFNGITGVSVVKYARDSVGLALAADGYASRMFKNDATPNGIIEHPGKLSDRAAKRIANDFHEDHGGVNKGKVAVFEEGMKWQQIGMTSEDSQYLKSREFSIPEVARWFRMPPHMIQHLANATFSNIEHQSLEFVIFTMMPWFRRWESGIRRDLISDPKVFCEFLVDALLRGDTTSRYNAYRIAIMTGFMTRNEARVFENWEPLPGLDDPIQQLNTAVVPTSGAAAAQAERAMSMTRAAAERAVRKETAALEKAWAQLEHDDAGWKEWVATFYSRHFEFIAEALAISRETALQYVNVVSHQVETLGGKCLDATKQVEFLISLAMNEKEIAA